MTYMEKVIKALEFCLKPLTDEEKQNYNCTHDECPYFREYPGGMCLSAVCSDALALLKARQPRVLTVEEVQTAPENSVIWYEINDAVFGEKFDLWPFVRSGDYWFSPEFPTGGQMFDEYDKPDYGKKFRCWSTRPTDAERRKVAWE